MITDSVVWGDPLKGGELEHGEVEAHGPLGHDLGGVRELG